MKREENTEALFDAAVFIVQNLPKNGPVTTTNDEKLLFYGYFKQAQNGKCNTSKPKFYDLEGVYKWNSWNSLGEMDKETAKCKYVETLVNKIRNVQKEYKSEEWMQGETYELLAPKMQILGVMEPKEKPQDNQIESETTVGDNTQSNESICAISDTEYADAIDEDDNSRSSSFVESRSRRSNSSSLKQSCSRLERELKLITAKIDNLGKAVEDRHNLLLNLMKKATVYVLVPRATSYRTIIFFIFWPFVAHFLLRTLHRFLSLF